MIRLNVFIQVEEKNQSELLGMVKELVELSQAENGCIAYDVFESSTRFDVMMICETWQDNETLIAHTQSEHYKRIMPKIHTLGTFKTEKFEF